VLQFFKDIFKFIGDLFALLPKLAEAFSQAGEQANISASMMVSKQRIDIIKSEMSRDSLTDTYDEKSYRLRLNAAYEELFSIQGAKEQHEALLKDWYALRAHLGLSNRMSKLSERQ